MDNNKAASLKQKFVNVLEKFAEQEGLVISVGSFHFTDSALGVKITLAENNLVEQFRKAAIKLNDERLSPDDYGRIFTVCGKEYKVVGLSLRAKFHKLVVENVETGKQRKWPVYMLVSDTAA